MTNKINSRNKGSKNERSVSKLFTQWTGFEFARTPQSGGLHWQKKNTIGDIVCIDDEHGRIFPFSIECKFHGEVDFSYLIDGTTGKKTNKVTLFWDQAKGDAMKVKKHPLLFIRRNMMKAGTHFVGVPTGLFNLVRLNYKEFKPEFGILRYKSTGYDITFVNSVDFFKLPYSICLEIATKTR